MLFVRYSIEAEFYDISLKDEGWEGRDGYEKGGERERREGEGRRVTLGHPRNRSGRNSSFLARHDPLHLSA